MSVRATMAALISRVRTLIYDPSAQGLSDQQIQDALDRVRVEQRWVPLRAAPTFQPGGVIVYLDYYSEEQNWEDDVVLQDMSDQTLAPSLSETLVGHWTFATQPAGMAVRATGKTYDLYAAAADLLDDWAAQVKLDFSFSDHRDQYQRQQKFAMLTALAQRYRAQALPRTGRLTTTDDAPTFGGAGVTYPALGGRPRA